MVRVKDSELYNEVLKELNYSFGNVYIFEEFVVSEFNSGVIINWEDHAKKIVDEVTKFYDTDGSNVIYISNRINSYSVVPSDWLKFFKSSYGMKAYCIVTEKKAGFLNSMIEKLFFPKSIKHFANLYEAVNYVKKGLVEID